MTVYSNRIFLNFVFFKDIECISFVVRFRLVLIDRFLVNIQSIPQSGDLPHNNVVVHRILVLLKLRTVHTLIGVKLQLG